MKLVKLSLAAVVAAGSFSFVNAVALDEAIQNVDLSGYLRYRYDSSTAKVGGLKVRTDAQAHKYKAYLKFTSDIADNFKAVAVMQYGETTERSWKNVLGEDGKTVESFPEANVKDTFKVRDAYLSYNNFDTTIDFGRMELGSFWTDDLIGNGIKVSNNSIEGVTLAAYMFDNYNDDSDLNGLVRIEKDDKTAYLGANNLYGLAALVDFAPVTAELWVAYMNKVAMFYAVDLGFNGGDDDFGYSIHGQYAGNALKNDIKGLQRDGKKVKKGNFYGIEAGVSVAGFDANLGYVGFGKKNAWTMNSIEDNGQLISAGEIVMDGIYNGSVGKAGFIFGTLGYTFDDVKFGVDVVSGKVKIKGKDAKEKYFEITPRVSYKYSDKLTFSSYYAHAKAKNVKYDDMVFDKVTAKEIRLEAKYSF